MRRLVSAAVLTMIAVPLTAAQVAAPDNTASNYNHLRVLKPYLGHWVYEGPVKKSVPGLLEKGKQIRVEMKYEWAVDKNALILHITITPQGAKSHKIIEVIGWDAKRQIIVSGAFNSAGGMSYSQWKVDENRLLIRNRDVSAAGKESSSTIVHELHDDSKLIWSETERTTDGKELDDSPSYVFRQVAKMKDEQ